MSFDKELILDVLEGCRDYFDNRSDADCDQDGFVPNKEMILLSNVQSALEHLSMTKPVTLSGSCDLLSAAKGIKSIVEELNGSMTHGTWRDDRGMRLKDTPEWIALYNAVADAERDHRDGPAQDRSHYYSVAESAWDEADNGVSVFTKKGAAGGSSDNKELDGTDVAHPAWWRGNDAGVLGAVGVIRRALEKGQCPDTGNAGLSELCKRVVSTQSDLRSLRDNGPYVVGGNHGWEAAIDAVSELVESSGAPGATRLADQIRDLNKLPFSTGNLSPPGRSAPSNGALHGSAWLPKERGSEQ
ncbi:hypothetical protein [Shinella sp. M31]|uniref:hypothetical protein n=1 Tax=Shinella sp. M31 TaxID=3368615 RepID=UPI003BA0ADC2